MTAATGTRAGGRTDAPLTARGRAQADALADRVAAEEIAAVYSSPIVRARETAERVATRIGQKVRLKDGLQELDHGRWTDRPLRDMRRTKLFEDVVRTPSRATLPDGEGFLAAQARAADALEEIVKAHRDEEAVVAVSHADVIKLLVAYAIGLPLDHFQRLVVSPASLTRVVLPKRGSPLLLTFNEIGRSAGDLS